VSAKRRRWAIRLASAAEADFAQIVRWTASQFGTRQAQIYARTLSLTIEALSAEGPEALGCLGRDDILAGLRSLHVARKGRKGRHVVVFRVQTVDGTSFIEVLRVLHDAMDLPRHLSDPGR
jgi:toxin ParE1/3/4